MRKKHQDAKIAKGSLLCGLCALVYAFSVHAQWSPELWVSNGYRGTWTWTDDAGTARTGTVKDGRIFEMCTAVRERYEGAGQDTNGVPSAGWYIWERSKLAAYKVAVSNALEHYAHGPGLTNDAPELPALNASNTTAWLSLPTNFWERTPWIGLGDVSNRYGWRPLQRVVNAMTASLATVSWSARGVTNVSGTLADPSGEGTNWASALADADAMPAMSGIYDQAPRAWVSGVHYPDTGQYEARWETSRADATNSSGFSSVFWKHAGFWWFGSTAGGAGFDVVNFHAAGLDLGSNTWRRHTAPTNLAAAAAWNVADVGPGTLARQHDGTEPVSNTTWCGFIADARMVLLWTGTTNGFRFR